MLEKHTTRKEEIHIDGKLNEVVTLHNEKGDIIHKMILPLMVEFQKQDIIQVIVGSTILAIPLCYTQEVWTLGNNLSLINTFVIMIISVAFISMFTYYTYYVNRMDKHSHHFVRRVLLTYLLSFCVVGTILLLIGQLPFLTDFLSSFKRCVIVAFPASMSATIADVLK